MSGICEWVSSEQLSTNTVIIRMHKQYFQEQKFFLPLFFKTKPVNLLLQLSHHSLANRYLVVEGKKFSHLSAPEHPGCIEQHPCVFPSPSPLVFDTFPAAFALLRKPQPHL